MKNYKFEPSMSRFLKYFPSNKYIKMAKQNFLRKLYKKSSPSCKRAIIILNAKPKLEIDNIMQITLSRALEKMLRDKHIKKG